MTRLLPCYGTKRTERLWLNPAARDRMPQLRIGGDDMTIKTYPEMNAQIVKLLELRNDDEEPDPVSAYAAARIVELEERLEDALQEVEDIATSGMGDNVAPWCGNKAAECLDGYGYCRRDEKGCKGFISKLRQA